MSRNITFRVPLAARRPGQPPRYRSMTPAEVAEHQLRRIVALGASVRETAWEAAQMRLANIRHQQRSTHDQVQA